MKTVKYLCAVALLGLMTSTATAAEESFENRWYIGAGLGISELDPDVRKTTYSIQDSRDSGYLLNLGYDLSERISIEGHYADLGEAAIAPGGTIGYQIFGVGASYYLYDKGEDHRGLGAFLKAGLGVMKNDSDLKFERQNDGHIFFGAGVEYGFDNGFALRTELSLYDEDAQLLSVSLLKRFGGNEHKTTVMDDDRDGVVNSVDQCPMTPPGLKVDSTGCEPDGDRDGVVNRQDQCPTTPQGSKVDATGCEPDGDQDGVVDSRDSCLNTPLGAAIDATGCALDRDNDGILDSQDKCLNSAADAMVDNTGCVLAAVTILKGVQFESSSAELKDQSKRALDKVVDILKRYPQIVVEVAGYTDSQGARDDNEQLSERRAKAVVSHLLSMGVNGRSMIARGYGPAHPVADNDTAAGRAENRRVELHILAYLQSSGGR
ncbi:MAG: OmpA family protein [Gammaproteobacteria bacterium]|nr:OmpA family protein [Gammaproteobacteria bacterium]